MTSPLINYLDLEQGSVEWIQARVGKVTASRCGDVIATIKRGEAADRAKYRTEIVCEILTGQPYPQYVSAEMKWGIEQEQFARAAYDLERDVLVDTCGFVLHPSIPRFGASPDGLVGHDGLIQIKCPTMGTHLNWLKQGVVPVEHGAQMLAELACTGREWCDFVSFDPRQPQHLQLFVRRFQRDPQLIAALEGEVVHFLAEVDRELAALPQKPQGVLLCMDQVNADEPEF